VTELDHFFAQALETGDVPRNWKKNPMLVPRGAPRGHRVEYIRASSFTDDVVDKSYLQKWTMRYLAIALSQPENDDLRALLAGETYQTHNPIDEAEKRASGRRVDAQIARALDRQGIHRAADRGTAVHSFAPPENDTTPPPEIAGDIYGFKHAMQYHGYREVGTEMFFAADEVLGAGTGDCLVLCPDGWVRVGDRKTGKRDPSFIVQIAIYSHGNIYNSQTDERETIDDWVKRCVPEARGFDRTRGLVFDVKPEGTRIYRIPLDLGWDLAKAIHFVGTSLVDSVFELLHDVPKKDPILERIAQADTVEALEKIYRRAGSDWNDVHTEAAKARKKELIP